MRHRILATAVLLALLASCQASAPAPTPTALPSAAPSPTATPKPTPSSEPEPSLSDDLRPVYQTVRSYLAAYDAWGANPTDDYTSVTNYTTGDARDLLVIVLRRQKEAVARVTGEPIYRGWSVRLIDPLLDGTAQASVEVCSDNAKMTLEHKDGRREPATGTHVGSFTLQQVTARNWVISQFLFREESC
ncbi:MAG: hypothetical protein Q3997_07650 [Propionibacteriaceae bacterium]|nr:hypothetical protein [Propionibacteriaceae bacterium]